MSSFDVDTGSVHDFFVKHISHDGDPFYRPPEPADGRWQRWLACQKVGDALHDDGYDALLVASAARQMSPICSAFADTAAGELQGRRGSFLIAGQRLRPFVRW